LGSDHLEDQIRWDIIKLDYRGEVGGKRKWYEALKMFPGVQDCVKY
jgi:hypothetical protein